MDTPLTTATVAAYATSAALSAVVTLVLMPRLIRSFKARGMVGIDQNKFDKPKVTEMGGVAVVAGFFVGVVTLMLFDFLTPGTTIPNTPLFLACLIASLGCAFVGAIDDLFALRQRVKAVLPILFGLPVAIYYPDSVVHLPRGIEIQFGLLMIPTLAFMISAGANAANMLEGFNGLGAGLGLIMSGALALLAVYAGRGEALLVVAPFMGATVALLVFNKFPAKVFPGDTFTLFMGATIVSAALLVNLKEAAAVLFIPMIAEFFLKARTGFTAQTYGKPDERGQLSYSGRIGSLTHVMMRLGRRTEKQVVRSVWMIEGAFAFAIVALILV